VPKRHRSFVNTLHPQDNVGDFLDQTIIIIRTQTPLFEWLLLTRQFEKLSGRYQPEAALRSSDSKGFFGPVPTLAMLKRATAQVKRAQEAIKKAVNSRPVQCDLDARI
jgi:hypothetical protein